jgi:hypothetical protein
MEITMTGGKSILLSNSSRNVGAPINPGDHRTPGAEKSPPQEKVFGFIPSQNDIWTTRLRLMSELRTGAPPGYAFVIILEFCTIDAKRATVRPQRRGRTFGNLLAIG